MPVIKPTLMFARWQRELAAGGDLPSVAEMQKARRQIMVPAHILPFISLAFVLLARSFGYRRTAFLAPMNGKDAGP